MALQSPPRHVYIGTSVLVGAIISSAPHAAACGDFCDRLIAAESRVYFSQILRMELSQALRRLATTRTNLSPAVYERYGLANWGASAAVRRRWLELGVSQFRALLSHFALVVELPFREATWLQSVEVMAADGLQARDAVHVATARDLGLRDLATVDADFQRVRDLRVWLLRDPVRH